MSAELEAEVARLREALALHMVAIERLAEVIAYETPDDLTPMEVDNQRYLQTRPILISLGMTIEGDEQPAWGFDWPPELSEQEREARAAIAKAKGDPA